MEMSELTRLYDEAERLSVVYRMYKDSDDAMLRRKAHVELDRFLMTHRELAIMLVAKGLQEEIDSLVDTHRTANKTTLWRRLFKKFAPGGLIATKEDSDVRAKDSTVRTNSDDTGLSKVQKST